MTGTKPRCGPGSVRDHGAGLGLADPWLRSPSSLAIHNIGSVEGRQHAVEEAARVLRTGGRLVVVDIMHAADHAQRLTSLGLSDVAQQPLGWGYWYGGPWMPLAWSQHEGLTAESPREATVLRVGDASRIGLEPSHRARPSCHARDMADFTVETTNGVVTSYSGVEARHDLNSHSGVLVVWDGKGKRLKFSPCGWLSVVDEDQAMADKHQGVETA